MLYGTEEMMVPVPFVALLEGLRGRGARGGLQGPDIVSRGHPLGQGRNADRDGNLSYRFLTGRFETSIQGEPEIKIVIRLDGETLLNIFRGSHTFGAQRDPLDHEQSSMMVSRLLQELGHRFGSSFYAS